MCAIGVIPTEVIRNISARGAHAIIGLEINPFVFHAAPDSLDEDVVAPGTAAIHRQPATFRQHHISEFGGRKLTALIGINDLRRAISDKRLLDDLPGVRRASR